MILPAGELAPDPGRFRPRRHDLERRSSAGIQIIAGSPGLSARPAAAQLTGTASAESLACVLVGRVDINLYLHIDLYLTAASAWRTVDTGRYAGADVFPSKGYQCD